MTPDKYIGHLRGILTERVVAATTATLAEVENDIRKRFPANRRLTREALRRKLRAGSGKLHGTISLQFGKRYKSRGTKTQQLFRKSWDEVRPTVRGRLFTNIVKG